MSANIVIKCDHGDQDSTCAIKVFTLQPDAALARVVSASAGWKYQNGKDTCPQHSRTR